MDNQDNRTICHPLITAEHLNHDVAVYIRQSSEHQVQENTGSTEYQRRLVDTALAYGWRREQVMVIEDDLGRSGTGVENRPGFKRMEELILSGRVRVVIAANASRLSRNLLHLIQLFALAARFGVLLILDNKVIDPRDQHDIFVSQILGSVAEYENRIRAETMRKARLAKAKRGEVVIPLPVGLLRLADGTIIKNPEVKDVIEVVLTTFWEARSALGTLKSLRQRGIKLPSRRRGGKILWKEATLDMVRSILLNPAYTGTFAYGQSEAVPELRDFSKRPPRRKLPEERWIKFYNRLPAYISPEEQEEIRKILSANSFAQRRRPGRGSALLQGIVVCGRCGAKLTVSYGGSAHGA